MSDKKDLLTPCYVCKKQWSKKDTEKYYSHESIGIICRHHQGVTKWYNELVSQTKEEGVTNEG